VGISGNLETMELAELLQWLSTSQKTGTLAVDDGAIRKQIVFRDGRIISTASSDPREHLGAILISHGFVTDGELAEAIARQQRERVLIGKLLVAMGSIGERDLYRMLRLKAEESLYDVFTWTRGEFKFHDGQLPPPETLIPLALDVAAVVLEGMQRIDEWRRIREILPSSDCVAVAVGAFDESEMGEWDEQVLAHVDDDRSVGEIARLVHASEFYVSKILLRQLHAGRLKIVRPRAGARAAEAPEPDARPPRRIGAETLLEEARQRLAKGESEAALRHARAARALEPDDRKVEAGAAQIEETVSRELGKAAMRPTDVPKLARRFEDLSKLRLSPQEGYLLSRIDGHHDLRALLKIGPLSPLETQLLLRRLVDAGHVRLEPKQK
jgi:hypothetical protein